VTRLKRVAFGGIELGDLAAGAWRELSRAEVEGAFPRLKVRPWSSPSAKRPLRDA
jgi:16S rRNA U516 pseudouridylate synthase RsuA-like enzyme